MTVKNVLHRCLIFLSIFFVFSTLYGQQKPEVLTNAKIIELVKMGLSDALIVAKIDRSTCQCDTSTAAIGKLKAAKVGDTIILAMINSSDRPAVAAKPGIAPAVIIERPIVGKSSEDNAPAALSNVSEPGIYLFENGEMKVIEASVFSGGKINPLLGVVTYGIKKTKWRAKIRGNTANLQTIDPTPVFYFVFNPDYKNSGAAMAGLFWGMPATSPNEFLMVEMKVKQASREAILGEYGAWTGASMGARDKDIREFSFEKIRAGVYKVTPKSNLNPGEYCFYYAGTVVNIGFAGSKVFDFSVKR